MKKMEGREERVGEGNPVSKIRESGKYDKDRTHQKVYY